MIELPEALLLSEQLSSTLSGKTVAAAYAALTPHRFAWYTDDPAGYGEKLAGRTVLGAAAWGGQTELMLGGMRVVFSDGVNLRFIGAGEKRPEKLQLLVEFTDGSALTASVSMYGGILCFENDAQATPYYLIAKEKPSPLCGAFDREYWEGLLDDTAMKLSAKALLATDQRIPGLGNGVLQDILFYARIHPRRKTASLDERERQALFDSVKTTLAAMAHQGGRDTERDLFGKPGGYVTALSQKTVSMPCPVCGSQIKKEAYLGGSVYTCPVCQRL